ncbi:hypothetical protein OG474_21065 [Kribbella sp. NBC_01505]|uniref:hypothetical protein n=1 Tax=Kribbella sp. NBC_01505 TaxID=2903580 RepID=UPI0038666F30
MSPKFVRWIQWLTLGVPAIAALAVGLADQLGLADKVSEKSVARLTLLLVGSAILNLFVALQPLDALRDIRRRLAGLDLEGVAEQQRREQYAGVTKVHRVFPVEVFEGYLATAQQVTILNTWIPNLGRLERDLRTAITERRTEVRILMLHPKSELVGLRDAALRASSGDAGAAHVRSGVEDCLQKLCNLHSRLDRGHRSYLKVRVFDSQASISVYRADQHYLVSVFLHGQLAIDTPQFEIEGAEDTILGVQVQEELDQLWNIGHDVDLANWRESIEKSDPTGEVSP